MVDTNFPDLLSALGNSGVEIILVGGLAGMAHGASRATVDIDVVYRRTPENVRRLVSCLTPLHPYLRGVPRGLPFRLDETTIDNGLNFTLVTDLGDLDLLGDVPGGGQYENLLPHAQSLTLFGVDILCVTLEKLIYLKRAAGRPKDVEAIAEPELLLDERDRA